MSAIVTAVYGSDTAVTNTIEDLVATGIPRDRIVTDASGHQVSVTASDAAEPEITEILQRHQPTAIKTRSAT
ncbi:MAG: hypothetical protein K9L70_04640 [Thiohalocapsa sp.]|jgi:hypothetical protein|nr:hypothetical protein [Thiohalocapsa sp.]MCF7991494.1 hypothetical protein [Thiohalocapsa sp.]